MLDGTPRAPMATYATMPTAPMTTAPPYPQSPILQTGTAVGMLIVNIIIPGLGTLIAGIMSGKPLIGRAIAQFFLAIIIVGWVWGIVTGVQLLSNASWADKTGAKRDA
jgi:hypothetical protein